MKKIKNSKILFDEKDVKIGLFFVGISSGFGYALAKNMGDGKYAPYFAAAAGMTSTIDVMLNYFEITDSFYLTGALLGVMGGFQTCTNHKSGVYNEVSTIKGIDSSMADQIIENAYSPAYLAAHAIPGATAGLVGAYLFGWFVDKVTNKFGNKTSPYLERYKSITDEEDTAYTHEGAPAHDEI